MSCKVNEPNPRWNISRDTSTENQEEKFGWRIRNLVEEFHKRITKWNCDNWNYNVMCLPKSQTQEMVFKSQRKAYSKTTGNMLTWCHYRFDNRLMNKTRGYPDYIVIICGEVYISKMSTGCGSLHPNLEGAKAFKCPQYN